jgi:hypothetical protein
MLIFHLSISLQIEDISTCYIFHRAYFFFSIILRRPPLHRSIAMSHASLYSEISVGIVKEESEHFTMPQNSLMLKWMGINITCFDGHYFDAISNSYQVFSRFKYWLFLANIKWLWWKKLQDLCDVMCCIRDTVKALIKFAAILLRLLLFTCRSGLCEESS